MAAFTIVTDSNSDLVPGYAAENEIIEMELTYTMDGKTYRCNDPAYTRSAFYNEMRTGKLPICGSSPRSTASVSRRVIPWSRSSAARMTSIPSPRDALRVSITQISRSGNSARSSSAARQVL